jgi:hypothetical protein
LSFAFCVLRFEFCVRETLDRCHSKRKTQNAKS